MGGVLHVDKVGESALAELGNMVMGNAATIFSNREIKIDITTPTFVEGNVSFDMKGVEHICIPLEVEKLEIEIHVALR